MPVLILSFLAVFFSGCGEPEKDKPIWEDVKIWDIAPAKPANGGGFQLIKTANFDVYVFELPAKNVSSLDSIWEILEGSNFSKDDASTYLRTRPLYFNDIEVEFINCGSIPVHIVDIFIEPIGGWNLATGYGVDDGPVWVEYVNGIGIQLHPGEKTGASFKVHVEQSAEELTDYAFVVNIVLVQYNEADLYVRPGS